MSGFGSKQTKGSNCKEISPNDFGGLDSPRFGLQVARGAIPGWRQFKVEGRAPDIDFDINYPFVDLWELNILFSLLAVEATMSVSSDNANDSSGGSGATQIKLFGIDGSFLEVEETFTMNGVTPVVGSQNFLRVFGIEITGFGGSNENEGTISAFIGPTIFSQILPGLNRSFSGQFTIPALNRGYLTSFGGSLFPAFGAIGLKEAELAIRFKKSNGILISEKIIGLSTGGTSSDSKKLDSPFVLEAGTDIFLSARSNDISVRMNGDFHLFLEDIA